MMPIYSLQMKGVNGYPALEQNLLYCHSMLKRFAKELV
jgi:hypothetical protein